VVPPGRPIRVDDLLPLIFNTLQQYKYCSLSLSLKQLESETNKQTAALQCNTTVLQVVNEVSSDQSPARNSEQTLFDI